MDGCRTLKQIARDSTSPVGHLPVAQLYQSKLARRSEDGVNGEEWTSDPLCHLGHKCWNLPVPGERPPVQYEVALLRCREQIFEFSNAYATFHRTTKLLDEGNNSSNAFRRLRDGAALGRQRFDVVLYEIGRPILAVQKLHEVRVFRSDDRFRRPSFA